jgi:hypothetical protein
VSPSPAFRHSIRINEEEGEEEEEEQADTGTIRRPQKGNRLAWEVSFISETGIGRRHTTAEVQLEHTVGSQLARPLLQLG